MAQRREKLLSAAHRRLAALRGGLGRFEYVCSGNLQRRMLPCGNPGCRCRKDPALRHGPYYYWGRRKGGRLVQMLLSPAEARIIARAIRNYKAVLRDLREYEDEIVKIIKIRRGR